MPRTLVRQFQVLHFHVLHFQRPHTKYVCTNTMWVKKNPPWGLLTFSPKRLGIFSSNFTVPIYARVQVFIQLSPTMAKLCHIMRDHLSADGGHFEHYDVNWVEKTSGDFFWFDVSQTGTESVNTGSDATSEPDETSSTEPGIYDTTSFTITEASSSSISSIHIDILTRNAGDIATNAYRRLCMTNSHGHGA